MLKGHLQGNTGSRRQKMRHYAFRLGTRWRVVADWKSEIAGGLAEYIVTLSTTQPALDQIALKPPGSG